MAKIKISQNLKKVLHAISNVSYVARHLISFSETESRLENQVDYLSTCDEDNTKITFLTKSKEKQIKDIYPELNLWDNKFRQKSKPGSIIAKIHDGFSGKDIEIFNNAYISYFDPNRYKLLVVDNSDIKKYYSYIIYDQSGGTLNSSCMKHDRCQEYFRLYMDNPYIKMLVMVDTRTQLLLGRALLWEFDGEEKESGVGHYKIMDRIYTIADESLLYNFIKWANENGYIYKHQQNWNTPVTFVKDTKEQHLYFKLKLECFKYKYYPYLDTFKWIDTNSGYLYNYIPENLNNIYVSSSTDGSLMKNNIYKFDFFTKKIHDYHQMILLHYIDNCYVHESTLRYSTINECSLLINHSFYDEKLQDYIFNEEYDKFNNKESIENRIKSIKEFNEFKVKIINSTLLKRKLIEEEISSINNYMIYIPSSQLIQSNTNTDSDEPSTLSGRRPSNRYYEALYSNNDAIGPELMPIAGNIPINDLNISTDESSITSGDYTYNNLTLNGGTLTINANATLTINGLLTINSGTIINNGTVIAGNIIGDGNISENIVGNPLINNGTGISSRHSGHIDTSGSITTNNQYIGGDNQYYTVNIDSPGGYAARTVNAFNSYITNIIRNEVNVQPQVNETQVNESVGNENVFDFDPQVNELIEPQVPGQPTGSNQDLSSGSSNNSFFSDHMVNSEYLLRMINGRRRR